MTVHVTYMNYSFVGKLLFFCFGKRCPGLCGLDRYGTTQSLLVTRTRLVAFLGMWWKLEINWTANQAQLNSQNSNTAPKTTLYSFRGGIKVRQIN